jgi:hypothetical protein
MASAIFRWMEYPMRCADTLARGTGAMLAGTVGRIPSRIQRRARNLGSRGARAAASEVDRSPGARTKHGTGQKSGDSTQVVQVLCVINLGVRPDVL